MRKRLGWRFNQRHSIPDWIEHRYDGLRYARRVLVTRPQNLVGYWPMWEGNGVVSFDNSPQGNHDGAYTGVTLAEPGIGDGRYSTFFDGVNDFNNIHSAGLSAAFNGAEGTIIIWLRPNGDIWGTSPNRYIFQYLADGNNLVACRLNDASNDLVMIRTANGVNDLFNTLGASGTGWQVVAITWSESANEIRRFRAGAQVGAPVAATAWTGVGLNATNTCLGSNNTTPSNPWEGWEAHGALWNVAVAPAEIAFMSTL